MSEKTVIFDYDATIVHTTRVDHGDPRGVDRLILLRPHVGVMFSELKMIYTIYIHGYPYDTPMLYTQVEFHKKGGNVYITYDTTKGARVTTRVKEGPWMKGLTPFWLATRDGERLQPPAPRRVSRSAPPPSVA